MGDRDTKFPASVSKKLGSYVYLYIDPRDGAPFYVGKGTGNRCFAHLSAAGDSAKARRLRELRTIGREPEIEILRYGLTDDEAALVESCVIDLLGVEALTNEVRGKHWRRGPRGSVHDIRVTLEAKPVKIVDPVILINIARLYRPGMSVAEIYDATRHAWKVGPGRDKASYALSVHAGIVREVFEIAHWLRAGSTMRPNDPRTTHGHDHDPRRWEFVGRVADDPVRKRYLNRSVEDYLPVGMQNPIRYVNC